MSDSLTTLDNVIGKVEAILLNDQKIETAVAKSLSDMISTIIRSEKTHEVTNFDKDLLKMTISKPRTFYEVKATSENGLRILLSKIK